MSKDLYVYKTLNTHWQIHLNKGTLVPLVVKSEIVMQTL
jgi:hypothetical protein